MIIGACCFVQPLLPSMMARSSPIIRFMILGVEADKWGVRLTGAGHKHGIELEPDRQVEHGAQVEVAAHILERIGALDLEVVGVQGGIDVL